MTIKTLRNKAKKSNMRLIKYSTNNRWFNSYGPYAIADSNNNLLKWHLEEYEINQCIQELRESMIPVNDRRNILFWIKG